MTDLTAQYLQVLFSNLEKQSPLRRGHCPSCLSCAYAYVHICTKSFFAEIRYIGFLNITFCRNLYFGVKLIVKKKIQNAVKNRFLSFDQDILILFWTFW